MTHVINQGRLTWLKSLLDSFELKKAMRYKFDKHRNQYVSAQGTLRVLLGKYLRRSPEQISFSYTEYGKPYLENTNIRFNLSHSNNLILFAFSLHDELGVDIEYVDPRHRDFDIARRFFHPNETTALQNLSEQPRMNLFYRIWTAKEALLKACGKGLSIPLNRFSVIDGITGETVKLLALERKSWILDAINVDDAYKAALVRELVKSAPGIKLYQFPTD